MSISHVPDACLYLCACGLQHNSHQTSLDRVLLLSHIEVIKAQYNDSLYLSYFIFTCKSSLADPRLSTSISRQRFKKSRNTADSLSGFWSSGVPLVAIRYNAYKKLQKSIQHIHIRIISWHRRYKSSFFWFIQQILKIIVYIMALTYISKFL